MHTEIANLGISLFFPVSFWDSVDAVIDLNVERHTSEVALFISRLIKGLQDLSNVEESVDSVWGVHSFEIEDIGVVSFKPKMDLDSGKRILVIESIRWTFGTSRFFSMFEY